MTSKPAKRTDIPVSVDTRIVAQSPTLIGNRYLTVAIKFHEFLSSLVEEGVISPEFHDGIKGAELSVTKTNGWLKTKTVDLGIMVDISLTSHSTADDMATATAPGANDAIS